MAGERRIDWGADATDARYRTEDTGDGANFVVAEDMDGSTVLLEWDDSATPSTWQVRGPVEMNSNDITGVSLLSTDDVSITNLGARAYLSVGQSVSNNSFTKVHFDATSYDDAGEFDTTNHKFVAAEAGRYTVTANLRWNNLSSTGYRGSIHLHVNGARQGRHEINIDSSFRSMMVTDTYDLAAGDEVDCRVIQRSNGSKDLLHGTSETFITISQEG